MIATARQIKAGAAYVELSLDKSRFLNDVRGIKKDLATVGKSLLVGGGLLTGLGFGIRSGFSSTVEAASDAEEELNRFRAVFGALSGDADKFAISTADAVNRSATDIRKSLATFQSFFVGLDLSKTDASALSASIAQLTIDFASFNNIADEDATRRFLAALSGSTEVMDQFGINLKAAAIEQELLRQGIHKSTADASEQEKVMARLAIIARSMGKQGAIGDAVKTADSYANVTRGLTSAMKDLKISIGGVLLPVRTQWKRDLTAAADLANTFVSENQKMVKSVAVAGSVFIGAGVAMTALGGSALIASTLLGAVGSTAKRSTKPISVLGKSVNSVGKSIIGGAFTAVKGAVVTVQAAAFSAVGAVRSVLSAVASAGVAASLALYQAASAAVSFAVTLAGGVVSSVVVAISAIGVLVKTVGLFPVAVGLFTVGTSAIIAGFVVMHARAGEFKIGLIEALKTVGAGFVSLAKIAGKTLLGIAKYLYAGDILKAFQVLTLGMKAAWFEMIATIQQSILDVLGDDLATVLLGAIKVAVGGLKLIIKALKEVLSLQAKILSTAIGPVANIWRKLGVDANAAADASRSRADAAKAELDALVAAAPDFSSSGKGIKEGVKGAVDSSLDVINDLKREFEEVFPSLHVPKVDVPFDIPEPPSLARIKEEIAGLENLLPSGEKIGDLFGKITIPELPDFDPKSVLEDAAEIGDGLRDKYEKALDADGIAQKVKDQQNALAAGIRAAQASLAEGPAGKKAKKVKDGAAAAFSTFSGAEALRLTSRTPSTVTALAKAQLGAQQRQIGEQKKSNDLLQNIANAVGAFTLQ